MSTCELEKNNNKTSLSQHTPQPTAKYLFSQAFSNSGSPSLKRSSFSLFFSFFSSSFLFATPLDPSRPKHKDCPVGCRCGRGWGWGGSRGSSGCRKQAKFQRKKKKKKFLSLRKRRTQFTSLPLGAAVRAEPVSLPQGGGENIFFAKDSNAWIRNAVFLLNLE